MRLVGEARKMSEEMRPKKISKKNNEWDNEIADKNLETSFVSNLPRRDLLHLSDKESIRELLQHVSASLLSWKSIFQHKASAIEMDGEGEPVLLLAVGPN